MKFVSLVILTMMISVGAAAQTTGDATPKKPVANVQQKGKDGKAKPAAAKDGTVTTLRDEKAYQAKWTFEEMLMRRLEIGAEEAQSKQRKE
ncbi:MAG TPA: hypothetical protein VGN63_04250 [Flavisolibacter sp.]|jgi:hypothetical protein|nr:hypothetical protein [Flavisolibacter sp.]